MKQLIILGILLWATGCAAQVKPVPFVPVQDDITSATNSVKAAETDVQQAKPFVSPAGQPAIAKASTDHAAALTSLAAGSKDLAAVQVQVKALQADDAKTHAALVALQNSWGHKLQVLVDRFVTILLVLLGIHLLGVVLGIFLPPPYSLIAGIVAKVVNPLAWGVWLLQRFEGSAAAPVATAVGSVDTGIVSGVEDAVSLVKKIV